MLRNKELYSDKGGLAEVGEHFITSIKKESDKEYTVVEIVDTGIGMNEDVIKSLIGGNTSLITNRSYNNSMGTGLGVGVAKNICESLNIELKIASKEGVGTVFTMLIPVEKKEEKQNSERGIIF